MIHCSGCGKPIDKLPSWLAGTKVDFVCNNCPNRTAKSIAFVQLEDTKTSARADDDEHIDEEEIGDDLDEA
ncbi:hypothetical protein EON82_00110 [bacterium]|nr:MAG: hypothetical protein EON82_00110 [bacterium]